MTAMTESTERSLDTVVLWLGRVITDTTAWIRARPVGTCRSAQRRLARWQSLWDRLDVHRRRGDYESAARLLETEMRSVVLDEIVAMFAEMDLARA